MYKKILAPLDGSTASGCGVREAIALAVDQAAGLSFLTVIDDSSMWVELSAFISYEDMIEHMREYGKDLLAHAGRIAARSGLHTESILRVAAHARISDVIVNEVRAGAYDLIVMGTHGRHGFRRLALGSDAERVARISPIPVLLVRDEQRGPAGLVART